MGHIHYFFLEDWKLVTDFRHSVGIRDIYSDQTGNHLVVIDEKSEGYVYNPVSLHIVIFHLKTCIVEYFTF